MFEGVVLGLLFFFGYPFIAALIATRAIRSRLDELESSHRALKTELEEERGKAMFAATAATARPAPAPAAPPPPRAGPAAAPAPDLPKPAPQTPKPAPPAPAKPVTQAVATPPATPAAPAAPVPPRPAPVARETPAWIKAVKTWLFTGNLVAKMGLLILFIGVSFVLKYASERVTVPIELRLAGIVLADIGLLI